MAHTSTPKPGSLEDDFFARDNLEKMRKFALEQKAHTQAAEAERLKALHWMRCPKCGMELQPVKYRGVEVDTCFACGGLFLDKGELEAMAQPEKRGVLDDMLGWLKKK